MFESFCIHRYGTASGTFRVLDVPVYGFATSISSLNLRLVINHSKLHHKKEVTNKLIFYFVYIFGYNKNYPLHVVADASGFCWCWNMGRHMYQNSSEIFLHIWSTL